MGLISKRHALRRFDCSGQTATLDHGKIPRESTGGVAYGTCGHDESDDFNSADIKIHPAIVGAKRQGTECHEVVEFWNAELGWDLEHGTIQAIASALHQFLLTAVFDEEVDE